MAKATLKDMHTRMVKLAKTDMPVLINQISSIGPSLPNAANRIKDLGNVLSFVVGYLARLGVPENTNVDTVANGNPEKPTATLTDEDIAALPVGTAIAMENSNPTTHLVTGQTLDVRVGAGAGGGNAITATSGDVPEIAEPEPGDSPVIINLPGGDRKVIPARGSGAKSRIFKLNEPLDLAPFCAPSTGSAPDADLSGLG